MNLKNNLYTETVHLLEQELSENDDYKFLELKCRDYDNNLENLLKCIKDLSTAGHSFQVIVDPDSENSYKRTFGIDGDGCDQLIEIKRKEGEDFE